MEEQALGRSSPVGQPDRCPPGSERNVAWWTRRQLHETAVHRWDIEAALDQVTAIAPKAASDGVDEFLDVFVRTRGKHTLASPMALRTTDTNATWTVSPATKPGRVDVAIGDESAATTVSAPAEALLLALWGRPTTDSALIVDGDRSVAVGFGLVAS